MKYHKILVFSFFIPLLASIVASLTIVKSAPGEMTAKTVLDKIGVTRGICVVLEDKGCELAIDLAGGLVLGQTAPATLSSTGPAAVPYVTM